MGYSRSKDDRQFEGMIGAQIFQRRERRGLTQAELADLLGVHRNTIYRLECGLGCRASMLVKVMVALEIEIADFHSDAPSLVHLPHDSEKVC